MLTREELRTKLEPVVIEHIGDKNKLAQHLMPVAKEHFGEFCGLDTNEFEEMSERWNGVMADLVEEFNLRRH